MLDRTLCLKRRQAFLASMDNPKSPLVLADPSHLTWLSGFYVDPFSLGAGFGALLVINPDASCVIFMIPDCPILLAIVLPMMLLLLIGMMVSHPLKPHGHLPCFPKLKSVFQVPLFTIELILPKELKFIKPSVNLGEKNT